MSSASLGPIFGGIGALAADRRATQTAEAPFSQERFGRILANKAIVGNDHAIWRRLVLVPFARKFWNPDKGETGPDDLRQDKTLPAKLAAEAEGILAWMVRGCLEWQRNGLQIPDAVRAATAEYRTEQDTLGRFVEDCCTCNSAARVKFSDLYSALERWCADGGDNLPGRRFVGSWLKDQNFKERQSNGRWYLGIGLKANLNDN